MVRFMNPRRWAGAAAALLLSVSLGCSNQHHDACKTSECEHTKAVCDSGCKPACPAPACQKSCTPCPAPCMAGPCTPSAPLQSVQPKVAQLPAPAPLPLATMPPVSNERYKITELPSVPKPTESQVVVSQKPALDIGTKGMRTDGATVARRSFADITARPEFAHDNDYKWVVGELSYVQQKQQWRVRYTSIDDEDRYGGSVTLDASHLMDGFKSGQLVRVEGAMLNPDSREPAPMFRVNAISVYTKTDK
jgi:hypothetical protein